jgi:hypothetical protein
LERLQRFKERERKLHWGMAVTLDCQEAHPNSPVASLYAAKIARAAGQFELAYTCLSVSRKLDCDGICGNGIAYEENLIKRDHSVMDESLSALGQRLIIYACQKCGKPIEYISIPCMSCRWHPTTLDDMARSARLAIYNFSTWDLLGIGRGIAAGRKATEVVTNLAEVAARFMNDPQSDFQKEVETVLRDSQRKQKDNYFFWHEAATCERCGTFEFRQDAKDCSKCGASLQLPPPLRLLICFSRLIEHFQHNFEGPKSDVCDVFIRYIISLESKLYRQQETPSNNERAKVLGLMKEIRRFWTREEYGYINTADPQNITYELSSQLPLELKEQQIAGLTDFRDTLQFLANWMKRTKSLC